MICLLNPKFEVVKYDLKELPIEFIGRGEVKGFTFKQLERSNTACIYEVTDTLSEKWYEVFKLKINKRFSCYAYPKSKSFGVSAWTCKTLDKANKVSNGLNGRVTD